MAPPVLGYWKIRGLAEAIRLAFEASKQPYTERVFEQGDGPAFSIAEWSAVKYTLPMALPNLPYLDMGDGTLISESTAILCYVCEVGGMVATTAAGRANVMQWTLVVKQKDQSLTSASYRAPDQLPDAIANVVAWLDVTIVPLMKGRHYLVGEGVTAADFVLVEMLDKLFIQSANARTTLPSLVQHVRWFFDHFGLTPSKLPFNNKSAQIGGTVMPRPADYF
mmetsp:Transcript_8897/g.28402  ORF Transcript_8897/g.28402 Transcript_8897/m.28402 type:complete len:222 (-) Transcript_8897:1516-2181(-)